MLTSKKSKFCIRNGSLSLILDHVYIISFTFSFRFIKQYEETGKSFRVMNRYNVNTVDQKVFRFFINLEERSVSTAIKYKNCAQIFVPSKNKNPIRYTDI